MKKNLLFILLLPALVWGQDNVIQLKNLENKENSYTFPLLISNKQKVAEKINTFLQVLELSRLPKNASKLLKEKVDGLASMEWSQLETGKNILTIRFDNEGCGAYCETYSSYHNFDIKTGNRILLSEMFTEDGFKRINEKYKNDFSKKIKIVIEKINAGLEKADSETIELGNEQIEMYKDCVAYDISEYTSFYFRKGSIVLRHGRCSNHASRALDGFEAEYTSHSYAFKDIEKYLSPYGAALVKGGDESVKNTSLQGKIYKGWIGKYPITALINHVHDNGGLSMFYWYDKHKKLIEWHGHVVNKHFTLKERDPNDNDSTNTADIDAKWVEGEIFGTWTSAKNGSQALELKLIEY
jgi:hypothetical protein